MLTDFELGWLAGIIDGEGSINCARNGRRNGRSVIGVPAPQVGVQNTSQPMLDKVAELYRNLGIPCSVKGPSWLKGSTMAVYRVDVFRKRDVHTLLVAIRPLLVAKATQAREVIAWIERWPDCRVQRIAPSIDERVAFAQRISELNHGHRNWDTLKSGDNNVAGNGERECEEQPELSASSNGQSAAVTPTDVGGMVQRPGGNPVGSSEPKHETSNKLVG